MPPTLSVNLCVRVVSAVAAGASCHQAAERFGVSVASVNRWHRQQEGQVSRCLCLEGHMVRDQFR